MMGLRWGMVGGGQGAFIGEVHRMAARLDGGYQLLAGCFASDAERSLSSGRTLGVVEERIYSDFAQMAQQEAALRDGIEVVSIVTPNYLHFEVARVFLAQGIAVICEKPFTVTLLQAQQLRELALEKQTFLAVTYNYVENPVVHVARELVVSGELGHVQVIDAYYLQDWLAQDIENSGQKQAAWRTDPEKAGRAGCLGDIATHAYNLSCFVSGHRACAVNARLSTFVKGRRVDDHVEVSLSYADTGLRGRIMASQVMPGHENDLGFQISGTKASIEWKQEEPNKLLLRRLGRPTEIITRNGGGFPQSLQPLCRVPAGHPEGYLEAFANVYCHIREALEGKTQSEYPNVDQAVHDIGFVEACLASNDAGSHWVPIVC